VKLQRMPIVGFISPSSDRTISIEPPIPEGYLPVCFTAHAGEVAITNHAPHSVTLKNHALYPVAYCLLFVRQEAVELTLVPWRQVFESVKAVGRKALRAIKG